MLIVSAMVLLGSVAVAPTICASAAQSADASAPEASASQASSPPFPSFEVASIKPDHTGIDSMDIHTEPDRFIAGNVSAKFLIEFAFNIQPFQLSGGPSWIGSEYFDIDAKEDESRASELQKLPPGQSLTEMREMLQSLLANRFKLAVTHRTEQRTVYKLVVAKGGPAFSETPAQAAGATSANAPADPTHRKGIWFVAAGQVVVNDTSMSSFASFLARQPELSTPVSDATRLAAHYDFKLQWSPVVPSLLTRGQVSTNAAASDSGGTSLFDAVREQLGLELEPQKGPVDLLIIDHIEDPSPN